MTQDVTRRWFLAGAAAAGIPPRVNAARPAPAGKPAMLGGKPVRTEKFPDWPKYDRTEEQALIDVIRSKHWYRGSGQNVNRFEEAYARLTGAKCCLATANGTSALFVSLNAIGIGPGDEVIVPPYTFVATINVILLAHALPVFVDIDPATFQIDARKIEAAITDRTAVLMPVHMGGSAADLDSILAIGRKHKLPVIEDACQAHLGEWKNRKLGTWGTTGCFSFQASKNLNSGEGGAILSSDDDLIEKCYAFHNNSRGRRNTGYDFSYRSKGANLRMTEFQGALLMAQMTRLADQAQTRDANAQYLTSMLKEIPGVPPARMYEGCTRNAYHLFMFRYNKEHFAGLPRAAFLKALSAEGIPASGGYSPLNTEPFLKNALESRYYQAIYPKQRLSRWLERNQCPANDKLCEEAVWFTQNMLLAARGDMEQIADAIGKIQKHAAELKKA